MTEKQTKKKNPIEESLQKFLDSQRPAGSYPPDEELGEEFGEEPRIKSGEENLTDFIWSLVASNPGFDSRLPPEAYGLPPSPSPSPRPIPVEKRSGRVVVKTILQRVADRLEIQTYKFRDDVLDILNDELRVKGRAENGSGPYTKD